MQMVCNTSAGTGPEVHADIEALRVERSFDHRYGAAEQGHEIVEFVLRQISELGGVTMGSDEEMAIVVGILIQHDAGVEGNP
jgi:hypothetical protein